MAGELAVGVAAVAGAGVSSPIPGLLAYRLDRAKRMDDRDLAKLAYDRSRQEAIDRAAIESKAEYFRLCVDVARAAGRYTASINRVSTITSSELDGELQAALLELSLREGHAARFARDWFGTAGMVDVRSFAFQFAQAVDEDR